MHIRTIAALAAFALVGCGDPAPETPETPEEPSIATDHGVDAATKTITIGALNDESGPAAPIGKQFVIGKAVLAAQINAGGSGLLPEGWKVEITNKDHGYNPTQSVASYNEISEDVLFIGTSFGTPNTLPLLPMLERDNLVAYPASLSSEMAKNTHTPPLGPSYQLEAMRAMDFIVETVGDPAKVKAGIVYQKDDYGEDGLAGFKAAAEAHGVTIVSEQTVSPGQQDFTAVITGLKSAGAEYVLLTTLPSATGPIVGTAAQLEYMPIWIGSTPAWIDAFFKPEVIPSAVFARYHQMSGLPYWGEEVPGMDTFIKAFEAHGGGAAPDGYILLSYVQGLVQIEAAKRAIEGGDITRAGYLKGVQSIDGFDAGGLISPVSLSALPYVTGTKTRILKPDFTGKTWSVVADYAAPKSMGKAPADDAAGDAAGDAPAGE